MKVYILLYFIIFSIAAVAQKQYNTDPLKPSLICGFGVRNDNFLDVKNFPTTRFLIGINNVKNEISLIVFNDLITFNSFGIGSRFTRYFEITQNAFIGIGSEGYVMKGNFIYNPITNYSGAYPQPANKNAFMANGLIDFSYEVPSIGLFSLDGGVGILKTFNEIPNQIPPQLINPVENQKTSLNWFLGLSFKRRVSI